MNRGFTLAELLIALAILGVIATFTIPKVLQSQQDGKFKSIAKEAAATVSEAYQMYKYRTGATANTSFGDLTQFINYVRVDSTSLIDERQTMNTLDCASSAGCLVLHNGAILRYNGNPFGGTETTAALPFYLDPDGKVTSSPVDPNGPGKSVYMFIYYDGKLRTRGTIEPNTYWNGTSYATPQPSWDPPWFSWD